MDRLSRTTLAGSGLPAPPEINFSKISVGGDLGGLVFALGCVAITLIGLPALRPVMLASLACGVVFAACRHAWWRTHRPHPTSLRAVMAVAVLVIGPALVCAQQPPPGQPAVARRDDARTAEGFRTISGRIITADSGAPLRRARVTATWSPNSVSAVTDETGRYTLTRLPAGRFRVSAAKASFATQAYGQRHPNAPGMEIDLTTSRSAEHIDIALRRGGVIAGRIVDDIGEPAAYTRVSAMRFSYADGRRTLEPTGRIATTDDLGQYRLAGLPPGTYYVGTTPSPADAAFNLAASYYPGTQDMATAAKVTVGTGGETSGIDFSIQPGGLARLRGLVLDERGRPAVHARVALVSSSSGGLSVFSAVQRDGSFTLTNVAPGEYGLVTSGTNPDTGQNDICIMPIVVNGDQDDITVMITGGETVGGSVSTDDGTVPDFGPERARISMVPTGAAGTTARAPAAGSGIVRPDWTFQVTGAAGPLRVTAEALPDGWMLKQVLLGQEDVTDSGVVASRGRPIADLDVIITKRTTDVAGTVSDNGTRAATEYVAVVFADDRSRWTPHSRYVSAAQPDQQGRFRVKHLPPGSYYAIALDYLDDGAWEDPDVLESLRDAAIRFTLADGEHRSVSLPLTIRKQ